MGSVICPTATLLLIGSKWRGVLLRGHDQMAQRVQVVASHKASDGLRQGEVWRPRGDGWMGGQRVVGPTPSLSFQ